MKLLSRSLLLVLPLALAATLPAQESDPVVVTAGALQIRKSEFEAAIASLPDEYRGYASGPGRRQFADDYLRMRLLALEAEKSGVAKDPAVVQQLAIMRQNLLASEEVQRLEKELPLTDAELQQAYTARQAEFEQANARHILVAFKGSPAQNAAKPELTEEEAKAKAESLRAKIVGGASFEETAKAESDDVGSGANGGSLGAFGRGQMVPEFEAAAFSGKVGEISPVIRTQFGYHILRVDERTTVPFAEARPEIERTLKSEKLRTRLQEMQAAAAPKFDEAYFGPAAAVAPNGW